MKRSTPMRRTPIKSGRRQMPAKSRKRLDEDQRRYGETRYAVIERCGGRCEGAPLIATVDPVAASRCLGRGSDMHEKCKRSRGGSTTDPDNILYLCRPCHEFTEAEPAKATACGLLVPSWERD